MVEKEKQEAIWWAKQQEVVCSILGTDSQNGLSQEEAGKRLEEHGPNSLPKQKSVTALDIFLEQFQSLIIWVLIIAAVIAGLLGEWIDAIAIITIVILNGILGFVQEYRSIRSMEALVKMTRPTSKVVREGALSTVESKDIVPGDLVLLEAGDKVPADGRLIRHSLLKIQEAPLTGESETVAKKTDPIEDPQLPLGDRVNMVFRGTTVASGKGYFIATETGINTEIGRIAELIAGIEDRQTPLQKRLSRLGKRLVYACLLIVGIIFIMGELRGFPFIDMVMISLSLAVAAIPEGLPAVVTIALAIGMQKMARRNALIRKLSAVETLGCTTVICSDKTGTLTENKMRVHTLWANSKPVRMTGEGYRPEAEFTCDGKQVDPKGENELRKLLEILYACNSAEINQESEKWTITGDPTEGALVVAAKAAGLEDVRGQVEAEVPFDSERKRMSVLLGQELYVKGAPDVVLELSEKVLLDNRECPLTDEIRKEIQHSLSELASKGLRVLAGAYRAIEESGNVDASQEKGLVFVGFAAMRDPPHKEVAGAIQKCLKAGMRPVMVTGDHKETAVAIAKELKILRDGKAIGGREFEQMSDEELKKQIEEISVFSRVSAEHKMRIISALRKCGHVVAMTGDGVNDAPAVDDADIGVAMGLTGTDVTKGISDMIILDDNFSTIVHAVEEGRGIYDNIIKFASYLFSCNLAEILIIFISLFFLTVDVQGETVVILAPIHLLWINLVTDGLPAIALAMDPPSRDIMDVPPRNPGEPIFSTGWMLRLVGLSLILSLVTLTVFYIYHESNPVQARTVAFTMLVSLELAKAFLLRVRFKTRMFSNPYLFGAVAISLLLQLVILYVPFFHLPLKTSFLGWTEWGWIAGGVLVLWGAAYPIVRPAR